MVTGWVCGRDPLQGAQQERMGWEEGPLRKGFAVPEGSVGFLSRVTGRFHMTVWPWNEIPGSWYCKGKAVL